MTPQATLDELRNLQQEGGSFAFDEAVWETLPSLIADSRRLATLEAEHARLAALVEWRTLLAKAAIHYGLIVNIKGSISVAGQGYWRKLDLDDVGLPVETSELRAALLSALGEPTTTAEPNP